MVRGHVLHRCCNRLGGNALTQTIDINGYWTVYICYGTDLGERNSGFTATDFDKKLSIVSIGTATSNAQFFNTIIHEAKHVQSHICKYYHVPEDSESAAYLIGYLTMKMYGCFKELI